VKEQKKEGEKMEKNYLIPKKKTEKGYGLHHYLEEEGEGH